jgi:hypothetical protein
MVQDCEAEVQKRTVVLSRRRAIDQEQPPTPYMAR